MTAHVPALDARSPEASDLSGLRVLAIDDAEHARLLTRSMLRSLGVTNVFLAVNGQEALSILSGVGERFDLIICDWNMPGLTGIELLRIVRQRQPQTPFLMVTGRADLESALAAKHLGVSAFIAKPFALAQLEIKIRVLISRAKQRASA